MTMNVAGALALILCLTVTSSQQEVWEKDAFSPISKLSFTTESGIEEVGIERKDITLVTSTYDNSTTNMLETEAVEKAEFENRWGIQLTEEEIELLAKILWIEARGESVAGQEAVVEVIFNRMISEEFPDSLYDVLSQKKPVQFASWKLRDTATPTEKEYEVIYSVLNGETNQLREDTVYFATKSLTSRLDEKIGGHYFCY